MFGSLDYPEIAQLAAVEKSLHLNAVTEQIERLNANSSTVQVNTRPAKKLRMHNPRTLFSDTPKSKAKDEEYNNEYRFGCRRGGNKS